MTQPAPACPPKASDLYKRLSTDWQDVARVTRGIEKPNFKLVLLERHVERRKGGIFGRRQQIRLKSTR